MLKTVIKALAYAQAPRTTFTVLHPEKAVQIAKVPFDLRTAYAPRLIALGAALLIAPLAFRLGKRAGDGSFAAARRRARAAALPTDGVW
jgi:hypothetical protein